MSDRTFIIYEELKKKTRNQENNYLILKVIGIIEQSILNRGNKNCY